MKKLALFFGLFFSTELVRGQERGKEKQVLISTSSIKTKLKNALINNSIKDMEKLLLHPLISTANIYLEDGITYSHILFYTKDKEMIKFLLKKGANPKAFTYIGYNMKEPLLYDKIFVEVNKTQPHNDNGNFSDAEFKENITTLREIAKYYTKQEIQEIFLKLPGDPGRVPNSDNIIEKGSFFEKFLYGIIFASNPSNISNHFFKNFDKNKQMYYLNLAKNILNPPTDYDDVD